MAHQHHQQNSRGSHLQSHTSPQRDFNRAFALGVFLNLGLVVIQAVFGWLAHSLALVADAGHNFADVLGLLLAWWASLLVKRPPTREQTYGLGSASILAALANALFLLVTMGAVAWEAIMRFGKPQEVHGQTMIWTAALGILVNGASAALFYSGREGDLNLRSAFLHLASDAGISFGVLLAGVAIALGAPLWLDPLASLLITAIIIYSTWGIFRDAMRLALQGVPPGIDMLELTRWLETRPGVARVHDVHVWAMSTTQTALTAHLVKPDGRLDDELLREISTEVEQRFHIHHVTIQWERGEPGTACPHARDDVV